MRRELSFPTVLKHLLATCLLAVLPVFAGLRAGAASEEEYQVYKSFLSSTYVEKVDYSLYEKLGIYFIYNVKNEQPEEVARFFKSRAGLTLDPELVNHFVVCNRSPGKIDRKRFPATIRYSSQFIKKNVYSFSRVGFSTHKDEALFYASFSSLLEDGHGAFIYLKKTAGTWAVVKAAAVWMYGASVHPFNP
jgi:hypothetical protein